MDMHTHFLRDTRITTFVDMRNAVGRAGWNKELGAREQTIEDLKFNNYKKEMFLDSDTKISLISSAPSDIEQDWFLTNEQMAKARKDINDEAGSRRVFCHAIFTPGQPGWLEKLDAALALKPESCKGYTIGDNTHKEISRECLRGADGNADQGAWRRPCLLGYRRAVDRRAAMADRGSAPAGNPRSHAEEIRLRAARPRRQSGENRDLRRQQRAALQHPAQARDAGTEGRPVRADEGGIREGPEPSNTRYGYVVPGGAVDHSVFA